MTRHKLVSFTLALTMMAALLLSSMPPTAQAETLAEQAAPEALYTFNNTLGGPIPGTDGCSNWPFTRYFLVTTRIQVTDLNLGLNVTHGSRGNIRAKLTSPNGTVVTLFNPSSDTNNNYDILMDGDSGGPLDDNTSDDTGSPYYDRTVLVPALNSFDGEDAFGGWQLYLCDNTNSDDGSFNRAQLQITGNPITLTAVHKPGPPIYETYYMPWPEDQLWTAMGSIFAPNRQVSGDDECADYASFDGNPRQPMIGYSSLTISELGTVITYDQWEDGFEASPSFPTQVSTEVWGDGDLLNGVAPKDADDVLTVGEVLILDDVMHSSTLGSVVDFDGRDKISSSKPIAVTRAVWSDGSKTLFAHADEVYPTRFWGTDHRLPVGETSDRYEMFQYTGVSIMAAVDGTVVNIDRDADGTPNMTCNLNQGQSCQWNDDYAGGVSVNGLRRNSRITSNIGHPIQVNLLTGDYCAGYETRSFPLLPVDRWESSYYNPVGTITTQTGPGNDEAPTDVHLYNPNAAAITVNYAFATGGASSVSVPANSGVVVTMNNATGAHFYSAASTTRNVRDTFATQSYSRQDGSSNWTTNWIETGDDGSPSSGNILVSSFQQALRLNFRYASALGDTIERQANLGSATAATFSFDYSNNGNPDSTDVVRVRVSNNGGGTWTTLTTIPANTSGSYSANILASASGNTRVRFEIYQQSTSFSDEYFYIDNVDITYQVPSGGDPQKFYAIATVDSDNAPSQSGTDPNRNDRYDWGITLVPESLMTQWLIVGWAPGDDPTFLGTGAENTAPIWLTGGQPAAQPLEGPQDPFDVCIDDGGNGGPLLDPFTNRNYDRKLQDIAPRSLTKVYNGGSAVAGQDQTAMQIWVCDGSEALITAAWGEDPLVADPATPAMDMGDTVRNSPSWRVTKGVTLYIDANGNGLFDEGDTVRYSIVVENTGASQLPVGSILILDALDDRTTYVGNSTFVNYGSGQSQIGDSGSGTPFPLDDAGYTNTSAILVNGSMVINFDASINDDTGGETLCNFVTASEGPVEQTADVCFPVQLPSVGAIGNYVWVDENSDGYQDAGEPGIPNVRVFLYNTAGNVVATTWTDADGGYLFRELEAGSYFVSVDGTTIPAGMTQTTVYPNPNADFGNQDQSTGDYGYPVTIGGAQPLENLTADFGYNYNPTACVDNPAVSCNDKTAALGDRVWIDVDGDGAQDPEEVGVRGVTVQLFTAGPDGIFGTGDDVAGPTDVTDANGYYLFDGLTPGAYVVKVVSSAGASHDILGAGYTQTGDPDHFGTTGANNDNQTTTPVILAPGDVFLNADFGYRPNQGTTLGTIGDLVWFDANASGTSTLDAGEYGIPGVTVALIRDTNGDGTWDADGGDNTFGTDDDEPIIATDITNASGVYLFSGLSLSDNGDGNPNDADYIVWVNDTRNVLAGLAQTYDPDAPLDNRSTSALTVAAPNDLTNDFSYAPVEHTPSTGLIGDTVWFDVDGSGGPTQGSEPGIEGVMVQLLDEGGNLIATTTTDENGHYYFGGLPVSADGVAYQVKIADSNFLVGGVLQGMTNSYAAGAALGNLGLIVTLTDIAPNNVNLLQDFSYKVSATPGSIGNLIWEDLNANGIQDAGEPGIDGVTVDLYRDLNGNGKVDPGEPLIGTQTTTGGGAYLFTGLPTVGNGVTGGGAYVVDVTDTAGKLAGYWHSLSPTQDPYTNGGNDPAANSKIDPVAVEIGGTRPVNNLNADFGYYVKPASLGNFVWLDDQPGINSTDGDGIQNNNEPGIDGIKVTLTIYYADGTTYTLSTVTGDDPSTPAVVEKGWYSFGNLLLDEDHATSTTGTPTAGQPVYRISVPTGTGYTPTLINVSSNTQDMIDSDDHSGVDALATQGTTNVQQNTANPGNETNPSAGYDFGYTSTPLAVLLATFEATAQTDHVLVAWETVSEASNSGFNLYRSLSADGEYALLGFTPSASPGATQGAAYGYQDFDVTAGQAYWYKLEDIDLNGAATMHGPVSVVYQAPTAVALSEMTAVGGQGRTALLWALAALLAVGMALAAYRRRGAIA